MPTEFYRYKFAPTIPFADVKASLILAIMGTESLHGEFHVRLDASHAVDANNRCCVIDASTAVGRDLNRLFIGFVSREFGPDAFTVERITDQPPRPQKAAA